MIFDPLTGAALLVLAASPQGPCPLPKPTDVIVYPSTKEITYNYSKTMAQLQDYKLDTASLHGLDGIAVTQGFMKAGIKLVPSVKIGYRLFPEQGKACLWYDSVKIGIEIAPSIFIAREVKRDRCMSKVVASHEMRHIEVDRVIVDQYADIMGQAVYRHLAKKGFTAGPVKARDAEKTADRMQKAVIQVVQREYDFMDQERMKRQQEIDTLEEYNRVNDLCPDFKIPRLKKKKSVR